MAVCLAGVIAARARAVRQQEEARKKSESRAKDIAEGETSRGLYVFYAWNSKGVKYTREKFCSNQEDAEKYRDLLYRLYRYKTIHFYKI